MATAGTSWYERYFHLQHLKDAAAVVCLTSCSTFCRLHFLSQSQWMSMAAHSNRSQLHAMPCHCVFPCAWVPASICNFAITTGFQTTFGIQHLRSGQWGMVLPPKINICLKKETCLSNCWAQICRTYTAHSPCLHQHQDCSHLASVPGPHVTVEQHAQMPLL